MSIEPSRHQGWDFKKSNPTPKLTKEDLIMLRNDLTERELRVRHRVFVEVAEQAEKMARDPNLAGEGTGVALDLANWCHDRVEV